MQKYEERFGRTQTKTINSKNLKHKTLAEKKNKCKPNQIKKKISKSNFY